MNDNMTPTNDAVIQQTVVWFNEFVLDLNLCPFAHKPHQSDAIRWIHCDAEDEISLSVFLENELTYLHKTSPQKIETTVICLSRVLEDFDHYNQFLDTADSLLQLMHLDGAIQIASFHPQYRFAGTQAADRCNLTNRSPYPLLHLIRENSIEQALNRYPDPDSIVKNNIERIESLSSDELQVKLQRVECFDQPT